MTTPSDFTVPEFPQAIGGETLFMKSGIEYRIMRFDSETWLIHKRNTPIESFELHLTLHGKLWHVEGYSHNGPVFASGITSGEALARLL